MGGSPSADSLRLEVELMDDPLRLEPSQASRHYLLSKLQWLRHMADCNRDDKKVPTMGEFYYCPQHGRLLCAAVRDWDQSSSEDRLLGCGVCLTKDECLTLRPELPLEFENCSQARQRWQKAYSFQLGLKRSRSAHGSSSADRDQSIAQLFRSQRLAQIGERLAWLAYDWSVWNACVPLRGACRSDSGAFKVCDELKRVMRLRVRDSTDRGIEQLSERNRAWCFEHNCCGDAWPWRQLQNYDPDCGICYERPKSPRPQPEGERDDDLGALSSLLLKHASLSD